MRRNGSIASLLSAVACIAYAQGQTGVPSAETIANADQYQPPRLADYAAKLAQQPDMSGLWSIIQPPGAGRVRPSIP